MTRLILAVILAASVGGWATYYDVGPGLYGAAGPSLRRSLGHDWRGATVRVCSLQHDCVTVRLVDWCACGPRHGTPTVIDLSPEAFRRLAPLSQGVVRVTIGASDPRPNPTGPPTDVKR